MLEKLEQCTAKIKIHSQRFGLEPLNKVWSSRLMPRSPALPGVGVRDRSRRTCPSFAHKGWAGGADISRRVAAIAKVRFKIQRAEAFCRSASEFNARRKGERGLHRAQDPRTERAKRPGSRLRSSSMVFKSDSLKSAEKNRSEVTSVGEKESSTFWVGTFHRHWKRGEKPLQCRHILKSLGGGVFVFASDIPAATFSCFHRI
ncbi:uncharacterized protein [Narcine bancroftii]|uniref:uncharacterized protein n=1 Tax=Narcine bancroftii TaxID=1343680 RepID=UPI0038319B80